MNREVLAVPEGRRMLFVRVTRSDLARREGLRELGWVGVGAFQTAWVLGCWVTWMQVPSSTPV